MPKSLLAVATAAAFVLTSTANAGDSRHNNYHGNGNYHWNGHAWVVGPLVGGLAAAALLGGLLTPYAYAAPYTYPYGPYAVPAYPQPRWCPNPYGEWFQC